MAQNQYRDSSRDHFVIEGKLTDIDSGVEVMNMVEAATPGGAAINRLAMIAGAMGNSPGLASGGMMAANEMVAVDAVSCRIGGKTVIGQFTGVRLLQEGDNVRAAVSETENGLYAHAIERPSDGLLWLPMWETMGRYTILRAIQLYVGILGILGYICMWVVMSMLMGWSFASHNSMFYNSTLIIPTVFIVSIYGFMVWQRQPFYIRAEKTFRVLDFPNVQRLNFDVVNFVKFHPELRGQKDTYQTVFYYQELLHALDTDGLVHYHPKPLPEGAVDKPDPFEEDEKKSNERRQKLDDLLSMAKEAEQGRKN